VKAYGTCRGPRQSRCGGPRGGFAVIDVHALRNSSGNFATWAAIRSETAKLDRQIVRTRTALKELYFKKKELPRKQKENKSDRLEQVLELALNSLGDRHRQTYTFRWERGCHVKVRAPARRVQRSYLIAVVPPR
jgi:hypothetical protein